VDWLSLLNFSAKQKDIFSKGQTRARTLLSLAKYLKLLQVRVFSLSKVFIISDALDECSERDGVGGFIFEVRKLQPNTHGLITSHQERERVEIHQPRRNSFDLPTNRSPVRIPGPGRIVANERNLRRQASHQARIETRRFKEAERGTARTRQVATREAERLREVSDFAQHFRRMAINERENPREAENEVRRLTAAEKQEPEERVRRAEYAMDRGKQLRERAILQPRLKQAEMDDRLDNQKHLLRRPPVRIVQAEKPFPVDCGTPELTRAQDLERQRQEDELLHRMERDRRRGLPRPQRSIMIFEDDTNRGRRHRI
jgi:hypothetical protein